MNDLLAPVNTALSGVGIWLALLSVLLLILCIAALCVAVSRGRRCEALAEAVARERAEVEAIKRGTERARAVDEGKVKALQTLVTAQSEELDALRRMRAEYAPVQSARVEADRILREAKERAYELANQTDRQYAELIDQGTREAESIRVTAQERLNRSHNALKRALNRANEIVADARLEAARIAGLPQPPALETPLSPDDPPDEPPEADGFDAPENL